MFNVLLFSIAATSMKTASVDAEDSPSKKAVPEEIPEDVEKAEETKPEANDSGIFFRNEHIYGLAV